MNAKEKLAWILARIAEGKTVYFQTMTRCTKVDKKTLDKWEKGGNQLFLASENGHLYMAFGKRFLIVDGCRIFAN